MESERIQVVSRSIEDTHNLARALLRAIKEKPQNNGARVVLLRGDLGAGKTTFVVGFLDVLGIVPRQASPTFVLMKKYITKDEEIHTVYHIDAYRLTTPEDAATLHLTEILKNPHTVIFIEWPDHIDKGLFADAIEVSFEHGQKENERVVSFWNVK